MNESTPAYGLWSLVLLNSAIFIMFAFSFFKPQTARDWRTFGAFAAFIVALFVEMYGFPLTIYLLSGWLQTRYPGLDILSHDAGHLWATLLGDKGFGGDPHSGVLHLLSYSWFDMSFDVSDIAKDIAKRPFILVGFSAFVLLTPLAATSFNRPIKPLGAKRWQTLHKLVYATAGLGILHFFWMRAGKNNFAEVFVYAAILVVLLGWRIAQFMKKKRT